MKKWKAVLLLAACCLMTAIPFLASAAAQKKGWDSTKTCYYVKKSGKLVKATGLKKIGGSYYYFNKKGVVQKNKWVKKLAVKGKKYTFYFGKNGKAYQAPAEEYFSSTAIKTFKIGGKTYGFDESAHMVTGYAVTKDGKLFYFDKKGVYNAAKTKQARAITKIGKTSKTMLKDLVKILGKPKKKSVTDSCNYFDLPEGSDLTEGASYTGYLYSYGQIEVSITRNDATKVYHMDGVSAVVK